MNAGCIYLPKSSPWLLLHVLFTIYFLLILPSQSCDEQFSNTDIYLWLIRGYNLKMKLFLSLLFENCQLLQLFLYTFLFFSEPHNHGWVLPVDTICLNFGVSWASCCQSSIPMTLVFLKMLSLHLIFGLPKSLLPWGFSSHAVFINLVFDDLSAWPRNIKRWRFIFFTMYWRSCFSSLLILMQKNSRILISH